MKLLVDCHCFDYPLPQGINTYIRGLYTALIPKAKDITFYLCAADVENLRSVFGNHANIVYVTIPHSGSLKRLFLNYPKIIKKYGIDWAHFQYTAPFFKPCKIIVTLHDILFKDYPEYFPLSYRITKGLLFKYSAKCADILLTVSEYSKKSISRNFKIPINEIFVTNNAVDDVYSDISLESAKHYVEKNFKLGKYILYVSRIEPRKNQAGLIKAFQETGLSENGYQLVIVGKKSMPYADFDTVLKEFIDNRDEAVKLLSGIDNESLRYLYRAAEFFAYPALAEGFGIPPLEAAMAEIPVICNNATAMADFTFFGDNLVDASCVENLKNRIVDVALNPPSEAELRKIRTEIMKKYSWDTIADGFYKYLVSR